MNGCIQLTNKATWLAFNAVSNGLFGCIRMENTVHWMSSKGIPLFINSSHVVVEFLFM